MNEKKKIESIAKRVIGGFDPDKDMGQSFDNLGLDSLDKFSLIADVEDACHVSMPVKLEERVNSVADIVVSVENLKRVKMARDTWVPCTYNGALQCGYMSDVPDTARWRATVGPDVSFCEQIACRLHGKQR